MVVQHTKKGHNRHRFKVFLDTNDTGRFDGKDDLIGKTRLFLKHSRKGVGNLLEEDQVGQLEVKFKTSQEEKMRDALLPPDEDTQLMQQDPGSGDQTEDQTSPNKLGDSEEASGGILDLVNTRGGQSSMPNIIIPPPTPIDTASTPGVPIDSMIFGA